MMACGTELKDCGSLFVPVRFTGPEGGTEVVKQRHIFPLYNCVPLVQYIHPVGVIKALWSIILKHLQ